MPKLEIDGARLEYLETGNGQPVVVVHGSASDYRTWESQQGNFSEQFRTIVYSRRYHWPNEQIPEEGEYSMREHVEDLEALLEGLDAAPAHLVGHSYGTFLCLLLAIRAPKLVRTLILAEPPVVTLFVSTDPGPLELLKLLVTRPRIGAAMIKFAYKGLGPAVKAFREDAVDKGIRRFGAAVLGREDLSALPRSRKEQIRDNRSTVKAELLGGGFAPLDPDELTDGLSRVDEDGTIVGDEELDRLATAVDDLDAAVGTAESVANDHLRDAIKQRDVTIEGQDFLSLVEQGARVDSLLARELDDAFDAALEKAHSHLTDSLDLTDHEAELAEHIFGGEPTFPVSRRDDAVSRLNTELTSTRDRRSAELKADLADDLAELKAPAEKLVRNALELDVELAIAAFAADFDCTMPTFVDDSVPDDGAEGDDLEGDEMTEARPGFTIEGGRSPILDVDFGAVEPVDYTVEGVTLLSGVNSGGKTSLLDLVGLIVIAAQMGLPVPAEEVRLSRFTELHYYAKSQGTLDAGAFESTLQEFGDLVSGADGRLVLVDELESITEPGASAKLIAGILEALDQQQTTAVFVSHLAREIREAADIDVAVDGIEAEGLVDGELQVNRSPVKEHLARSTPELIVEKLAADDDGEFYESLLEKF